MLSGILISLFGKRELTDITHVKNQLKVKQLAPLFPNEVITTSDRANPANTQRRRNNHVTTSLQRHDVTATL